MSIMGFFEPAASPTLGALVGRRNGTSGGITFEGPALEGRISVNEALEIADGPVVFFGSSTSGLYTVTPWNQAETDAIWAGRDSVFG